MDRNKTTLERAFELAQSGEYDSVRDIRGQLRAEGYAQQQVEGRALTKQLKAIIEKARTDASEHGHTNVSMGRGGEAPEGTVGGGKELD